MKHSKLVAAAAISASVVGGAAGGALLFAPNLSGAQEATTTVAAAAPAPAGRPGPGPGLRGDLLTTAAKALGMTEADLRTELKSGKTIAQVATAKGVDVQKVIDALVAEATTDLKARITDMVNGTVPLGGEAGPKGREGFGPGGFGDVLHQGLDAVASALGMTEADLRTALQSGTSIADIAKSKGVSVDTLVGKLVATADAKIDQAVKDGKLTADQATKLKAGLKDGITALVNGSRPALGGRRGFGHGGPGGPAPQGEGSSSTSGAGTTTS